VAYGRPDHHRKHCQQMTYALPHGRASIPGMRQISQRYQN
jgi:hypothetical protein